MKSSRKRKTEFYGLLLLTPNEIPKKRENRVLLSISELYAAADAVFVFKEQKTELLLKITEKPIRRGKWLSKSTSLTSRT